MHAYLNANKFIFEIHYFYPNPKLVFAILKEIVHQSNKPPSLHYQILVLLSCQILIPIIIKIADPIGSLIHTCRSNFQLIKK